MHIPAAITDHGARRCVGREECRQGFLCGRRPRPFGWAASSPVPAAPASRAHGPLRPPDYLGGILGGFGQQLQERDGSRASVRDPGSAGRSPPNPGSAGSRRRQPGRQRYRSLARCSHSQGRHSRLRRERPGAADRPEAAAHPHPAARPEERRCSGGPPLAASRSCPPASITG